MASVLTEKKDQTGKCGHGNGDAQLKLKHHRSTPAPRNLGGTLSVVPGPLGFG